MPNWVTQRIYFQPEDKTKLQSLAGLDFNFQDITPMPERIKYTRSPANIEALAYASLDISVFKETYPDIYIKAQKERETQDAKEYLEDELAFNFPLQDYYKKYELPLTLETWGNQLFKNLTMYHHPDWCDWAIEHWGTTGSPYPDQIYWTDHFVQFETAWVPARPIVQTLSEYVPLVLEWTEEEEMEHYGGFSIFKDGRRLYRKNYPAGSLDLFNAYQRMTKDENVRYDKDHFVYKWDDQDIFRKTPKRDIPEVTMNDFLKHL